MNSSELIDVNSHNPQKEKRCADCVYCEQYIKTRNPLYYDEFYCIAENAGHIVLQHFKCGNNKFKKK